MGNVYTNCGFSALFDALQLCCTASLASFSSVRRVFMGHRCILVKPWVVEKLFIQVISPLSSLFSCKILAI